MSRTINYGITKESLAAGTANSTIIVGGNSRLTNMQYITPNIGGTGINTSVSTGVAKVNAGNWSVSYINANDFGQPYSGGLVLGVNSDGSVSWVNGGSGPSTETVTNVSVLNYTRLSTDMNLAVDASIGAVTINLGTITGVQRITIFDSTGFAGVNNITITPGAGTTIMRSTDSLVIATQNTAITLLSMSSTNWQMVSKN